MGLQGRKQDLTTRLREAITSGRFMPNERLVEMDLAAALGANRANVRTALAQLEQEGLVVREPNRGARVRLISPDEAIEIMQARAVLEVLVARQAAVRATPEDHERLHAILREMRAVVETGDLIRYSRLNGRLHAELQHIAGHQTATKLLATLKSQIVRFQYRAILLPGRSRQSLAEHQRIVEAICTRDPDGAGRRMSTHLRHAVDALKQVIEATTDGL